MIFAFLILSILAIIFSSIRFFYGPCFSDKMVAVDILTTILIAAMVVLALFFKNRIYIDVSLALSSVSFIGMIILGRFIEE